MSKRAKVGVRITDPRAIEFLELYRAQSPERQAAMVRYANQRNAGMSCYLASVQFAVAMGRSKAAAKLWARQMCSGGRLA
jgi:hypothetical protein